MSTPPPPASPPPVPPAAPEGKRSTRGCVIAVVITLVVLLGACGACTWYCATHAPQLVAMGLSQDRGKFEEAIADDVSQETREAFWAEYDAYIAHFETMQDEGFSLEALGPAMEPMQALQQAFADGELSEEEMRAFIERTRAARGAD